MALIPFCNCRGYLSRRAGPAKRERLAPYRNNCQQYSVTYVCALIGNYGFGIFKALAALWPKSEPAIDILGSAGVAACSRADVFFTNGIADADEHCRRPKSELVANDSQ
jgi:hypothetical protein